jgi:hypothetical protein
MSGTRNVEYGYRMAHLKNYSRIGENRTKLGLMQEIQNWNRQSSGNATYRHTIRRFTNVQITKFRIAKIR